MKTRAGFVSNSSSSSFILGYGIVTDVDAFKSYCKKHGIDYEIMDGTKEWSNKDVELYMTFVPHDEREIYGGNYTSLTMPTDVAENPRGQILRVSIRNNEGDSAFWDEENEEMCYDAAENPSYYGGWQEAVIDMFGEKFIKDGAVTCGAERNG